MQPRSTSTLTSKETDPKFAGKITWNFEKFLFDRDGKVVARFSPKTQPDSPEVVKAIETELAKKLNNWGSVSLVPSHPTPLVSDSNTRRVHRREFR